MANFFNNFVSSLKKSFPSNERFNNTIRSYGNTPSGNTGTPYNAQNTPLMQPNASTGATPSTPPPSIAPPKTSPTLPPSGQNYVNSLVNQGSAPKPGVPTPSSPTPSSSPQSAYLKYLTGMFDENNVNTARKAQEDSAKRLSDIQNKQEQTSLNARREYEKLLDASGGLKSGAQQSAAMSARRSDSQLADIAIQESAAARSAQVAQDTYKQYIDAGKSVYEAETAAAKAKQDQDNKDREFNENKRQFGLEYALKAQKQASEIGDAAATSTAKQGEALSNVNLINTLLGNKAIDRIAGPLDKIVGGAFGDAAIAKNQFNQIKGILSLENRSKLKGQGAVSDFEGRTLDRAASSLGRNLSNTEFKKQLLQVKGSILTSHGLPATVLLVNQQTGESQVVEADSSGIANAINDGFLVEYQ